MLEQPALHFNETLGLQTLALHLLRAELNDSKDLGPHYVRSGANGKKDEWFDEGSVSRAQRAWRLSLAKLTENCEHIKTIAESALAEFAGQECQQLYKQELKVLKYRLTALECVMASPSANPNEPDAEANSLTKLRLDLSKMKTDIRSNAEAEVLLPTTPYPVS